MYLLILILTALLLIPAAVAGIVGGTIHLIAHWSELASQLDELVQVAQPLWGAGQSVLGMVLGLTLLVLAAGLLIHALKSRP